MAVSITKSEEPVVRISILRNATRDSEVFVHVDVGRVEMDGRDRQMQIVLFEESTGTVMVVTLPPREKMILGSRGAGTTSSAEEE